MRIHSVGYLEKLVQSPGHLQETVDKACHSILRRMPQFDAIAFRGLSGSILSVPVSLKLNKYLIAVRKDERNHSGNKAEGVAQKCRYIIVDDLVDTGSTVHAIRKGVWWQSPAAECVGIYLYYIDKVITNGEQNFGVYDWHHSYQDLQEKRHEESEVELYGESHWLREWKEMNQDRNPFALAINDPSLREVGPALPIDQFFKATPEGNLVTV